jgi:hypothetical protein
MYQETLADLYYMIERTFQSKQSEHPNAVIAERATKSLLFPAFNHDDMITKSRLHFNVLRTCRRAGLQFIRRLLEVCIEATADFPAKRPACR